MRKFAVPAAISLVVVVGALLFLLLSTDGGLESPYAGDPSDPVHEDELDDELRDVDLHVFLACGAGDRAACRQVAVDRGVAGDDHAAAGEDVAVDLVRLAA